MSALQALCDNALYKLTLTIITRQFIRNSNMASHYKGAQLQTTTSNHCRRKLLPSLALRIQPGTMQHTGSCCLASCRDSGISRDS